ncbi:hypothetical protein ACWGNU_25740 [Paenibacillus lautus]
MRVFRWKTFGRPLRFSESIRPLRWFMWGNPLHILSQLVGEGREVEARCAAVSFLQSLLSPNFLE